MGDEDVSLLFRRSLKKDLTERCANREPLENFPPKNLGQMSSTSAKFVD
jgi:hypothetical protein